LFAKKQAMSNPSCSGFNPNTQMAQMYWNQTIAREQAAWGRDREAELASMNQTRSVAEKQDGMSLKANWNSKLLWMATEEPWRDPQSPSRRYNATTIRNSPSLELFAQQSNPAARNAVRARRAASVSPRRGGPSQQQASQRLYKPSPLRRRERALFAQQSNPILGTSASRGRPLGQLSPSGRRSAKLPPLQASGGGDDSPARM
jgi:hypothetical protein